MASGPEHYRDAERCLEYAKDANAGSDNERFLLTVAQVHATLALAAATALGSRPSSVSQMREWAAAIGDPYQEPEPDAVMAAGKDEG